jgi:hypothetical protein
MGYVPKNARKLAAILYVPYKTSWRDTMKNIVIKIVVTMPCYKTQRQTTYHQRYNALSALEVHNIGKVHHKHLLKKRLF